MTQAADPPHDRKFSIAHLALLIPWILIVIGAWEAIQDNSFLWHVRAGTLQADLGSVLTADPFSFTMHGEPWLTQSWLVELLYDWLERVSGGLGFVPFMLLVLVAATFLILGLIAYQWSRSVPATAFVMILSIFALVSFMVPRPVIFSYLLMSCVVASWARPSMRWMIPFLFWVWAGTHASFLVGLAYVGLSIIMEREWRALPSAIVAGLATLGTAHGIGVAGFLLDFTANNEALQYLTEWRKPELLETVFLPLLGGIVFIVIGAFRNRIFPKHLWLIVPFVLLGMSSVRAIPVAWIALVPLVATSLSGLSIGSRLGQRPHLAVVFAVFVLVFPFFLIGDADLSEERFPLEARPHLAAVPTLHDDVVGGYLIWADGPQRLVYLDDRAELYGPRMGEFVEMRRGEVGWEPIFERDGIEQALLSNDEPLVEDLTEAGWDVTYRDDWFSILSAPRT